MQKKIDKFLEFINESNNIVFFGGAGVSTESGIPDFRSKDGLYNQKDIKFENYSPEYLLSNNCLKEHPDVFYEFYRQKMDVRDIQPNITHKVLAKLEKQGKLKAIITQNIDGLHQKAGSKEVYEIHGTTQKNYCHKCKRVYPPDYLFQTKERIPKCDCGGMIRPDVTLYGEDLPDAAWDKSMSAIQKADMLIIAGTSLQVYPAAYLVSYFHGKHLVILNKEDLHLPLNETDDLFFQESMGEVFKKLKKSL